MTAVWGSRTVHAGWDEKRQRMQAVGEATGRRRRGRRGPGDVDRRLGHEYWTGHGGVVLVNDPIETVEEVARAYDIRWLVLEPADTVPAATGPPRRANGRPGWAAIPSSERSASTRSAPRSSHAARDGRPLRGTAP